jgi:glycosyltransferase involved in cell wall biosynthesis
LRIVQIHNQYRTGAAGGEPLVVKATGELLEKYGHYVRTLERDSRQIKDLGDRISAFMSGMYSWQAKREMGRVIEKEIPDVVHVHNLYPLFSPSVLVACRDRGVPVVMTVHNFALTCPIGLHLYRGVICERCTGGRSYWCILRNCRGNALESIAYALRSAVASGLRLFSENVTLFISPSEFVKQRLVRTGLRESRIVVVPNVSAAGDSAATPTGGQYVAFVGRLFPEKGGDTLVAAARHTGLPVRVAGDGPARPGLAEGSPHSMEFVGRLDRARVAAFYRGARFAVVPSLCLEAFGLVATEAMSHGLPVIASRIGALPEIVEDGVTGYLFEPGNARDLAGKMERLWKDPDLCRRMGQAGREKVVREYREELYYRRLVKAYRRAIEAAKTNGTDQGI